MQAEEPSSISSDSSPRMEKTSFTPAITPIMLIQTLLQNKEMKGTEQSQPFTPRKTIKDVLQMIRNLNFWAKIRILQNYRYFTPQVFLYLSVFLKASVEREQV